MESWLKIYYNDLLMEKILKLFHIEEQLHLRQVSERFQYVIDELIRKKKCGRVRLEKSNENFAMTELRIKNDPKEYYTKPNLSENTLYELLKCLHKNLKEIIIYGECCECSEILFNFKFENFDNLETVKFDRCNLKDDNIKLLQEQCKNLKELEIHGSGSLLTGRYMNELKNLAYLSIELDHATWNRAIFFSIFQSNLKYLNISGIMIIENHWNFGEIDLERRLKNLETIKMRKSPGLDDCIFDILRYITKPLENLKELEMEIRYRSNELREEHFQLIHDNCINLNKLTLSAEINAENLIFSNNLQELHIDDYRHSLSFQNVWNILADLTNLTILTIKGINFECRCDFDFHKTLGLNLKILNIQAWNNDNNDEFWLPIFEDCNEQSFSKVEELTADCIDDIYIHVFTQKFPKLLKLSVNGNGTITGKDLYRLHHLKILNINTAHRLNSDIMPNIIKLLNQLNTLSLCGFILPNSNSSLETSLKFVNSNLNNLRLSYKFLTEFSQFWLDFLRCSLIKIDIYIDTDFTVDRFNFDGFLCLFSDLYILQNIKSFKMVGRYCVRDSEFFIDFIFNPVILKCVKYVRVNGYLMDTSLGKLECLKYVVSSPINYDENSYSIVFKNQ